MNTMRINASGSMHRPGKTRAKPVGLGWRKGAGSAAPPVTAGTGPTGPTTPRKPRRALATVVRGAPPPAAPPPPPPRVIPRVDPPTSAPPAAKRRKKRDGANAGTEDTAPHRFVVILGGARSGRSSVAAALLDEATPGFDGQMIVRVPERTGEVAVVNASEVAESVRRPGRKRHALVLDEGAVMERRGLAAAATSALLRELPPLRLTVIQTHVGAPVAYKTARRAAEVDVVMVLGNLSAGDRRRAFDAFFRGVLPTQGDFDAAVAAVTQRRGALVLDRREEKLGWFRPRVEASGLGFADRPDAERVPVRGWVCHG
jgi:hypothetical protein